MVNVLDRKRCVLVIGGRCVLCMATRTAEHKIRQKHNTPNEAIVSDVICKEFTGDPKHHQGRPVTQGKSPVKSNTSKKPINNPENSML